MYFKVRREGCFASGAESVPEKYRQLHPLYRCCYTFSFHHKRLFPTPTLYFLWIKEISTRYGTCLLCASSVFTAKNLLILLTANPRTHPYYKHILRLLLRKPCHSELSRLTTCSRNWQLDKETHHFEFFFQTHWDAIQTRQGTFIPVTSSGGLSHLHREKKSIKHMLYIFS